MDKKQQKIAVNNDNFRVKVAVFQLNMMIWPVWDHSLPVFFSYLGERYARNVAGLKKEVHPLWTITIKRPGYIGIVRSTIRIVKMYP